MDYRSHFQALADAVLVLHFGVVLFIVAGLALIVVGNLQQWRWVNGWWFRLAHLAAIAVVVVQTWLGHVCPLTTLESWLRQRGGSSGYAESFVGHWLERLLFYDAPPWAFALVYTMFGSVVFAVWWYFPPRRRDHRSPV